MIQHRASKCFLKQNPTQTQLVDKKEQKAISNKTKNKTMASLDFKQLIGDTKKGSGKLENLSENVVKTTMTHRRVFLKDSFTHSPRNSEVNLENMLSTKPPRNIESSLFPQKPHGQKGSNSEKYSKSQRSLSISLNLNHEPKVLKPQNNQEITAKDYDMLGNTLLTTKASVNLPSSNNLECKRIHKKQDKITSLANLLAPPCFTEDNQEQKQEEDLCYSLQLSQKTSIANVDNLVITQINEEKTPIDRLDLLSAGNETPKVISKRHAKFLSIASPNSTSESNNTEECLSNSESRRKREHFVVKNSDGKIQKPSSFGIDTFSKRVEILNNEPNGAPRFEVFTARNNTDFFDINRDNKIFNGFMELDNIIKSSRRSKAYFDGHIIQPKFMRSRGSMCITELWSGKSKFEYLTKRVPEKKETKKKTSISINTMNQSNKSDLFRKDKMRMSLNGLELCTPSAYRTTYTEASPQRKLEK